MIRVIGPALFIAGVVFGGSLITAAADTGTGTLAVLCIVVSTAVVLSTVLGEDVAELELDSPRGAAGPHRTPTVQARPRPVVARDLTPRTPGHHPHPFDYVADLEAVR